MEAIGLEEERVDTVDNDRYWATYEDPIKLASECCERVTEYIEYMHSSRYWDWAMRSWRYYHGMFWEDSYSGQAIKQLGPDGDTVGYANNQVRNLCTHLHNMATRRKVAYKTRARNSELASLKAAELGDDIIRASHEDAGAERRMRRAAEHGIVLLEGFVMSLWDENAGDILAQYDDGTTFRAGDVVDYNPCLFDVVRDPTLKTWEDKKWTIVRVYECKWDLAAREPDEEKRKQIEDLDPADHYRDLSEHGYDSVILDSDQVSKFNDIVPVYYFFHEDTDAVPGGRMFKFANDELALSPVMPLPYDEIPVYRITAAEILMTSLGYSPALDMQAGQEMLNAELSIMATNHMANGVQHIFADEDSEYDTENISEGIVLVRGKTPAQGINLTANPPDWLNFCKYIGEQMELQSGVNSVVRGQPDANLQSGEALKVMDARALEFAAPLVESYNSLIASLGTFRLKAYRKFMDPADKRFVTITGEHSQIRRAEFTATDLDPIDRVTVEASDPLMATISGRIAVAENLFQKGLVKSGEQYLELLRSGQLKPLTRATQSQLDLITAENEQLRIGNPVVMSAVDYHLLHLKEHHVELAMPEVRFDPQRSALVLSHMMEHIQALMFQGVQMLQVAMGYEVPFPAMMPGMPPAGPGAPPPFPGESSIPEQVLTEGGPPPNTGGGPQFQAPPEMEQGADNGGTFEESNVPLQETRGGF